MFSYLRTAWKLWPQYTVRYRRGLILLFWLAQTWALVVSIMNAFSTPTELLTVFPLWIVGVGYIVYHWWLMARSRKDEKIEQLLKQPVARRQIQAPPVTPHYIPVRYNSFFLILLALGLGLVCFFSGHLLNALIILAFVLVSMQYIAVHVDALQKSEVIVKYSDAQLFVTYRVPGYGGELTYYELISDTQRVRWHNLPARQWQPLTIKGKTSFDAQGFASMICQQTGLSLLDITGDIPREIISPNGTIQSQTTPDPQDLGSSGYMPLPPQLAD